MNEVAPFYYFQFYTFDEHYSSTSISVNPRFQDKALTYEMELDSKAVNYLQRECLEVFLFDDNAPIQGMNTDTMGAADDLIGVARIPLNSIISSCSTHDKYPVKI